MRNSNRRSNRDDERAAEEILRDADSATYKAKRAGRSSG
jgi:GGDEF domain-containing protein